MELFKTLFTGKYVGKDEFGNKYYKNKNDERWVIYSGDIEATKITSDWYLWMHHTIDKIPDKMIKKIFLAKRTHLKIKLEQKIVISQQELKKMLLKKNMKHGSNKITFFY